MTAPDRQHVAWGVDRWRRSIVRLAPLRSVPSRRGHHVPYSRFGLVRWSWYVDLPVGGILCLAAYFLRHRFWDFLSSAAPATYSLMVGEAPPDLFPSPSNIGEYLL